MKSIAQVAKLTGVSIRTLQYYDEIGLLKCPRLDQLIQLLERLEKGEQCMSFKEFDLPDYINAWEDFKSNQAETVIQHRGSIVAEIIANAQATAPKLLVGGAENN